VGFESHLCDITAGGLRAEGTSKYGMCGVLVSGSKNMVGELALSEKLS